MVTQAADDPEALLEKILELSPIGSILTAASVSDTVAQGGLLLLFKRRGYF